MFIEINTQDMDDYVRWAKDKAFCNSGQHVCDRLATLFEQELEEFYADIKEIK